MKKRLLNVLKLLFITTFILCSACFFACIGDKEEEPEIPVTRYTVTVINGTGSGDYEENTEATVIALDIEGKIFKEWQINGEKVSENASYSFTVTKDVSVVAVYKVVVAPGVHDDAAEITEAFYWFNFSQGMPDFASSDKALSFDYKPVDKNTNVGNDFKFTIWPENWGTPRLTGIITVDVVNNTVTDGVNIIGDTEETDDGWFRVTVPCKNIPVNKAEGATGTETLGSFIFNEVNHAVLIDEVRFVSVEKPKPDPQPTGAQIALVSGFDIALPDYDPATATAFRFDLYAPQSAEDVKFRLCDDAGRYFGTYYFRNGVMVSGDGFNCVGVTCENTGGKTYRLIFNLDELSGGSAVAPVKITKIVDDGSKRLNGEYMDNLGFFYKEVNENAFVSLNVADNTAQVLQTESAPQTRRTTLSFSGAKGERETAQLTVYAKSRISDKAFTVEFTDFIGVGGTISKDSVTTYMLKYVDVNYNFYKDPQVYDLPLGMYPDALLPLSVAKSANENKLNVSAGNNQGLYFILDIPSDASKGVYYGNVIIDVKDSGTLYLPVEIEVYGFALPENNRVKVMMGISTSQMQALYGSGYGETTNALYAEIQKALTERGISTAQLPGSVYNSSTIPTYIRSLKKAAADPKVTAYKLDYNYDAFFDVTVSGTTYDYSGGAAVNLSGASLGVTYLPRVQDVKSGGYTYYGLIGLFQRLAAESTDKIDLFKKAYIIPPYDEHYGRTQEIQILLCKYATYYARDYVVANFDWTGKAGVKESLKNLRFIVAMPPIKSLYEGATIRVTDYAAPTFYSTVIDGSWMPTSNTLIKLDAFLTDVFKFDLLWGDTQVLPYSVPNSDEILEYKANPATQDYYDFWWYTPVGGDKNPHWASLSTNASVLDYRVNYWQQYKLGIDGMYYWSINNVQSYVPTFKATQDRKVKSGKEYYVPSSSALYGYERAYPAVGSSATGLYEPAGTNYDTTASHITETYILENGTHFEGCYGEATLVYMVKNTYGMYGVNFLTTLRLENTAEAIDDYNYLAYAQSLIDGVQNASTKAAYQARFDALFDDLFYNKENGQTRTCRFTATASDLKAARTNLATLIEDLLAK